MGVLFAIALYLYTGSLLGMAIYHLKLFQNLTWWKAMLLWPGYLVAYVIKLKKQYK